MKKQKQLKKLVLSKRILVKLTNVLGGKAPDSNGCPMDDSIPCDSPNGFTSFCSVIVCNSKIGC
jgi:hypothetical protein